MHLSPAFCLRRSDRKCVVIGNGENAGRRDRCTSEGREIRLAIAQAGSGRKGEEPKAANQFYAGDRRWSAELRAHQEARAACGGAILDLLDRALFGRIQHGGEQPVEMLAHRQARRG